MRFSWTVWRRNRNHAKSDSIAPIADTGDHERTYVSWADDCAVPVAHHDIVSILETIGARAVADALLALLELLEETEIPGD